MAQGSHSVPVAFKKTDALENAQIRFERSQAATDMAETLSKSACLIQGLQLTAHCLHGQCTFNSHNQLVHEIEQALQRAEHLIDLAGLAEISTSDRGTFLKINRKKFLAAIGRHLQTIRLNGQKIVIGRAHQLFKGVHMHGICLACATRVVQLSCLGKQLLK